MSVCAPIFCRLAVVCSVFLPIPCAPTRPLTFYCWSCRGTSSLRQSSTILSNQVAASARMGTSHHRHHRHHHHRRHHNRHRDHHRHQIIVSAAAAAAAAAAAPTSNLRTGRTKTRAPKRWFIRQGLFAAVAAKDADFWDLRAVDCRHSVVAFDIYALGLHFLRRISCMMAKGPKSGRKPKLLQAPRN